VPNAIVVHSKNELLDKLKEYPSEDVFIIGGTSIYKMMLPYCKVAHITKIDYVFDADSYFPDLDKNEEWKITEESDEQTYFDLEYVFLKYEK
jgi:dihydrofolate reductase